jgi:hypothetical protein
MIRSVRAMFTDVQSVIQLTVLRHPQVGQVLKVTKILGDGRAITQTEAVLEHSQLRILLFPILFIIGVFFFFFFGFLYFIFFSTVQYLY